jgi:uncharacterized protein YggE
MNKLILFALFIGMISCTATEERSIKLNVNHTVQIPIEYVTATVMITEYGSDREEVELRGYENLSRVVNLLESNGLAEDDLEIEPGQISDAYHRREDPYQFNSTVTFDISNTDHIDTFRRAIIGVGGTSFQISSYGNSDEESIYDEAYRSAINTAKDRAEQLLSNQKESVGKIKTIQEDIRQVSESNASFRNETMMAMNESFDMDPVDPLFRKEFYTKTIQFYIEFELN